MKFDKKKILYAFEKFDSGSVGVIRKSFNFLQYDRGNIKIHFGGTVRLTDKNSFCSYFKSEVSAGTNNLVINFFVFFFKNREIKSLEIKGIIHFEK